MFSIKFYNFFNNKFSIEYQLLFSRINFLIFENLIRELSKKKYMGARKLRNEDALCWREIAMKCTYSIAKALVRQKIAFQK